MRRFPTLLVLCASLVALLPAQNIPLSEYRARREALRKNLDGTLIHPAIFNAVADATGAHPTHLPLTPERLMSAMETIGA